MQSFRYVRPHHLLNPVGRPLAAVAQRASQRSRRLLGVALMYHRVAPDQGDPRHEIVPPIGADLFEAQLSHLARSYRLVRASELVEAVRRRRPGERLPVAITFDDDHSSHVQTVLPALRRAGVTATFFLTGASLDGPHRFWWELAQDAWPRSATEIRAAVGVTSGATIHDVGNAMLAMSPDDRAAATRRLTELAGPDPETGAMPPEHVQRLVAAGCEIGFHTRDHEPLTTLADDALARALRDGRERLESVVGGRLTTVAYPHGHLDDRVVAAARSAGFESGYTTRPTAVRAEDDPLVLGRLHPSFSSAGHLALQIGRRLVLPKAAEPRIV